MLVFTYGTLKHGFDNHHLLKDSTFISKAITVPEFTMIALGGFPGILRGGTTGIKGEIYEVDAKTLARLDQLEGHPNWYRREPIRLYAMLSDGVEAYIYLKADINRFPIVPSGEWLLKKALSQE